jgi:hypothetical protein
VAAGKDLVAAAPARIQGVVKVADGRPLVGAIVEAHAAAMLAGTIDPRRWPRTFTTSPDAAGSFLLAVDPGTYDVVVRPAEGTGFPWVASASHPVAPGASLVLSPIAVPAPVSVDLVLYDQNNSAVAGALVRAFAPPASAAAGGLSAQVQLGAWLTDASGHVTMFVAPPL